ncbi:MAG: HAMP domain-containing protein [Bacillaceae bacterium]|nr:HAMP domain-containing protein [Bacillaceae bacterium]
MIRFFKMSIERKLLGLFLVFTVVSVLAVGAVSYWTAFEYYKGVQRDHIQDAVSQVMYQYRMLKEQVDMGHMQETVAQQRLLQYIHDFYPQEVKIFTHDASLVNYVVREHQIESMFTRVISTEEHLEDWGWKLHVSTVVNPFSSLFADIQKYTIIVMVLTSITMIELIMMVAHHFSKPIRTLAEACEKIDLGSFVEPARTNRSDEVGILNRTFNRMVRRLKEKEKSLKEMQHLNQQILESTSMGILTLIEGKREKTYLNQAAESILQEQEQPSLKEKLIRISEQVWHSQKEIGETLRFGGKVLEVRASLLGGGLGTICTFQDITEREAMLHRMERVDRLASLGELAAGLAHEIRNPLTGIKTSVQVLHRKTGKDGAIKGLVDRMIREIDRLNHLIQHLLQFARPHGTRKQKLQLDPIIQDVLFLLKKPLDEKHIAVELKEIEQAEFLFDEDHLKQILLNLILNAIKASDPGGQITIACEEPGRLRISDNGAGMTAEQLRRCFDPFYTTDPQGTGLGLSVVHRLIEYNQADIQIDSEPGRGTTIVIEQTKGEEA